MLVYNYRVCWISLGLVYESRESGKPLDMVTPTGKRGSAALWAQTANLSRGIRYLGPQNTPEGGAR